MIQNDSQLAVVREQLDTAEAAIDALRRDVRPKNKQMYDLMAESYIDMLLELRAEIDAYLGIVSVPESAELVIALEGPKVALGRISAGLVTRFIDTFRRGLQSAVEIIESVDRPDTSRRRPRWIEKICDVPLIGVQPGSVRVLLGEPESESLFSQEEKESLEKALTLIFNGLAWAGGDDEPLASHPFSEFPPETRQAILALLTRLLPPRNSSIERVSFQRRFTDEFAERVVTASLTQHSRVRIRDELESLAVDASFQELEGVIRSVDLDARTFELRERAENDPFVPCEYGADLEEAVKEYLDCRVMVSGSLETSRKTQKSKLAADSIELISSDDVDSIDSEE